MDITPICQYCNQFSELVKGDVIYEHRKDLHNLNFYMCKPCDAYVGCHKGSKIPLGILANKELRTWKNRAHTEFDILWKRKRMSRSESYKWMQEAMGMSAEDAHIGKFNPEQCRDLVFKVKAYLKKES